MNQDFNLGYLCTTQQCQKGLRAKLALRIISVNSVDYQEQTYGQLDLSSNTDANVLESLGLTSGNQVFIYLPRTTDYYPLFLGALMPNLVVCPLFSNFGPDALLYLISGSTPKVIVTKASLYHRIEKILPQLSNLLAVILVDESMATNSILQSLEELRSRVPKTYKMPSTEPKTPSILHFTSGLWDEMMM